MPGAPRSDGKTFYGFYLYLAGRCTENPQSTRGPQAITWLEGVTIYCIYHFLTGTIHLQLLPRRFLRDKILLKNKIARVNMLIEQIIEFELRGLKLPGRICTPTASSFMTKQKSLDRKSSSGSLFTGKILQEAIYLTSPT